MNIPTPLRALSLAALLVCGACAANRGGGAAVGVKPAEEEPAAGATSSADGAARAPATQPPALVDVLARDSSFVLDIRYATFQNFTGKKLYPVARCLLRSDVAERLARVHERLKAEGLRLRLYDCYRPLSIQRELWALVPDDRYVADPAKGSRHNRAAAVDLTLADSAGTELPMPTEYDNFTPRAHRDYAGGTAEQRANRERLERAMTEEGFVPLPTEWWHFDDPQWQEYPILDVPLSLAPTGGPP